MSAQTLEFKCKTLWLDLAEVVDAWRVVPRLVLLSFSGLIGYTNVDVLHWYMALPAAERSAQVTAVIGIIIPSLSGLAVYVYRIYASGGRRWGDMKDDIVPQAQ